MRTACRIGLDIAKNFFQVHGNDEHGNKVFNKKLSRNKVLDFFANHPACLVGIEACGSAHHWGREIAKLGHEVCLISPRAVKPFVINNKTDAADAAAICEVVGRPSTSFVTVKTVDQQIMAAQCKLRERLIGSRTQLLNQARGIFYEFGIIAPQGKRYITNLLIEVYSSLDEMYHPSLRNMAAQMYEELLEMNARIDHITQQIEHVAKTNELCKLLTSIPSVGPLTAVTIIAHVGEAKQYKNGRAFAASLGLTPKEHSSGGKQKLLRISKRGDSASRSLLIQGARNQGRYWAVQPAGRDKRKVWFQGLLARRSKFVAIVALANKTARIIWAVLTSGSPYNANIAMA